MRSIIGLLLLFQASHGFAPPVLNGIQHRRRAAPATSLAATIGGPRHSDHDDHHDRRELQAISSSMPALVKDCKLAMAGLAVGCMLVFSPTASLAAASPSDATTTSSLPSSVNLLVAAGSYETLDFSLPSYGDATSSSTPKKDVPSFNPFGDFEPTFKSTPPVQEKAAPAPAPAAPAKSEPVEPMAAMPEFKLPEMKMPDVKMPDMPEMKMPAMNFKMPEMKIPEMKIPDMPEMKLPDVSSASSKFEMLDVKIPDVKMPDFKMPEFTAPKFKMPDMSELSAPKLPESVSGAASKMTVPEVKMPEMNLPKIKVPEVTMPDMPAFNMPKISMPSMGGGGGGGGAGSVDTSTPQTVRDAAAKAARLVYLDADQMAKDAEAKAREVRQAAEVQKKAANVAKDVACETRPGGKWICLRNPFTVGY